MPLETEETKKDLLKPEGNSEYHCMISFSNGLEMRLSPQVFDSISTFNGRCAIGILIKDLK
jgi:hypothetical protein